MAGIYQFQPTKMDGLTLVSDVLVTLTLRANGLTFASVVLLTPPLFRGENPHFRGFC